MGVFILHKYAKNISRSELDFQLHVLDVLELFSLYMYKYIKI